MNNKLITQTNYENLKNQFKQKWKELTEENLEDINFSKKQLIYIATIKNKQYQFNNNRTIT